LWSPKVLRAGMGAHFALRLVEGGAGRPGGAAHAVVATSSHAPDLLPGAACRIRARGCSATKGRASRRCCCARCAATLRIPQPGGEESLNVAAAAAICLYESVRQRDRVEAAASDPAATAQRDQ
jgi:TrmH family RNA methyltransferase